MQYSSIRSWVVIVCVVWAFVGVVRADDCNNNSVSDDVDISMGTSSDCNLNGVPDECELYTTLQQATPFWSFGDDRVHRARFSPDGVRVVTAEQNSELRLWDRIGQVQMGFPLTGHTGRVVDVAWFHDGTKFVSSSEDGTARVWDATTHSLLGTVHHEAPVWGIDISPDDSLLVTGGYGDPTEVHCKLWNANTGAFIRIIDAHSSSVNDVAFTPDGDSILTASSDNTAKLSHISNGQPYQTFSGHTAPVNVCAVSDDGTLIATGSNDGTARVWNVSTADEIASLVHDGNVNGVSFFNGSAMLATGSAGGDGVVRIWNIATGGITREYVAATDSQYRVEFSSDGKWLVSAGGSTGSDANLWAVAVATDCNRNGALDACDLSDGIATDNDDNGVLDQCEPPIVPSTSGWGVLVMVGIVLAIGTVYQRQRPVRPCQR